MFILASCPGANVRILTPVGILRSKQDPKQRKKNRQSPTAVLV